MSDLVAFKVLVYGRVQGVYYRAFVSRHATQLGLTGYVRNLKDRSVEVYAEGKRSQLEQLLENLKQGPPGARVENITTDWLKHSGEYRTFSIT